MRVAKVLGRVTLSRSHPSFAGGCLRLACPMSLSDLEGAGEPSGESLVVWDDHGAGNGSLIALSESGEAAQPFRPALKPVDAYNAAILDSISFRSSM